MLRLLVVLERIRKLDKVDEVGFEYSQLLISQLASRRENTGLLRSKGSINGRGLVSEIQKRLQLAAKYGR